MSNVNEKRKKNNYRNKIYTNMKYIAKLRWLFSLTKNKISCCFFIDE